MWSNHLTSALVEIDHTMCLWLTQTEVVSGFAVNLVLVVVLYIYHVMVLFLFTDCLAFTFDLC